MELEQRKVNFTKQKLGLEVEYIKQVDDMYFYGFGRCMKKHKIAVDIPSNNEAKLIEAAPVHEVSSTSTPEKKNGAEDQSNNVAR